MSREFIEKAIEELDMGVLEIELESRAHDKVYLHHFKSIYPGEGNGRLAMEVLTGLADQMRVRITLFPHADFGPKYLTQNQLIEWYRRLGFDKAGDLDGDIERLPAPVPAPRKNLAFV